MKQVAILYDAAYLGHRTPPGHPESPRRLERIVAHLRETGSWERLTHLSPAAVEPEALLEVHEETFLRSLALPGERYLDPDTYLSEGSWTAAQLAAGALCTAVRACRDGTAQRAFCAVRPPGHHAERGRAMGFCLVNHAAVAARFAQRAGFPRVMIADFDVHHGNGTQHIFEEDDRVFYFSTHEYPHYPGTGRADERGRGRGEGFTRNIPLAAGAGDAELVEAYGVEFADVCRSFAPSICIVSAGYDLQAGDPLADLRVTEAGIRGVVREILRACAGIPVVFTLEGGYRLEALARAVAATLEVMGAA